jgi:DNA-binding transcriptional LysR family regulator
MISILNMHDLHAPSFDLNLLRILDALLAEQSVTRAAERLNLTQPAVSHALARLRSILQDPLFIRTPRGMQPTPRAATLREPLRLALANLTEALAPAAPFIPATARRSFRIATDDYLEFILVPRLLARLGEIAPRVDIRFAMFGSATASDLADGKVDLALTVPDALAGSPALFTQKLFDERFVCLLRQGHPALRKRLTPERFAALSHVLVAPGGRTGSIVDTELKTLGLTRRVAVAVPHFLVAPEIVRRTDLVLTLGARLARALAGGLRVVPHPLKLSGFSVSLFWHGRDHADAAHAWFRGLLAEVARAA